MGIITSGKGVSEMTVQHGGSALFSSGVAVLTDQADLSWFRLGCFFSCRCLFVFIFRCLSMASQ